MEQLVPLLSPEALKVVLIADRSIWSDEVEMLAKLRAYIATYATRKAHRWERFLPERFQDSAMTTVVPEGEHLKQITRHLSGMLDGLVKEIKGGQFDR